MKGFLLKCLFLICSILSCEFLNGAWSPAIQISAGSAEVDQIGTSLIMDQSSQATVAWYDTAGGSVKSISSASLVPSQERWGPPSFIVSPSSANVPFLTLGQNVRYGAQLAGFGQFIGPDSFSVEVSRRISPLSSWQNPISQIAKGIPGTSVQDSDARGNFGAIIPILNDPPNPAWNIYLFQLGGCKNQWEPIVLLGQDNSPFPIVAMNMVNGRGILAWATDIPNLQILTQRYDFLNQKGSSIFSVPIPEETTEIRDMKVVTDGKGNGVLTMVVLTSLGAQRLYASTLFAGQESWSTPFLVSDSAHNVGDEDLTMDRCGNTFILWIEQIDAPLRQVIRVASLPLAGALEGFTDLTDRNNPHARIDLFPKIVVDTFGNAAALWVFREGGNDSFIQIAVKPRCSDWTSAETIATRGDSALLALSDQGAGVVTWIDSESNVLKGSRNLSIFSLASPSCFVGRIASKRLLTQKASLLNMHWNKSPAPNIIAYQVFKNGKLLASLPGNGKSCECIIPLSNGCYELVAIASTGNKSLPIPLDWRK